MDVWSLYLSHIKELWKEQRQLQQTQSTGLKVQPIHHVGPVLRDQQAKSSGGVSSG